MSLVIIMAILLFLGAICLISYLMFSMLKSLKVSLGKNYFITIVVFVAIFSCCSFDALNNFTYFIRNDLKIIGFPVPLGILKYEQDQWIDFPFYSPFALVISMWNSLLAGLLLVALIKLIAKVQL